MIYQFDRAAGAYTADAGRTGWSPPGTRSATSSRLDRHRFLVIERDNLQGDAAAFKKIYLVDLARPDGDGLLDKTLVADLLNIDPDPEAPGRAAAATSACRRSRSRRSRTC